ncbi:MAG TPA: hypothetical protein VM866_11910, partial [Pyrinomonadaceae bacterium]|nr:hypothetical protein [Pyrinomonadaceae bacterium]
VPAHALSSQAVMKNMKCALLLVLALTLGANCTGRAPSLANRSATQNEQPNAQPTAGGAKPATANGGESPSTVQEKEVPAEFKDVDFKNFSYPTSLRRRAIQLKEGTYEHEYPDYTGGDTFDCESVDYADVTGDGKKEAIVRLHRISCGASCDGGSHLFYIYSSRKNRPVLFWRIESGSTGYGGGLKSFAIKGQKITLELFNNCRYKGATPVSTLTEGEFGKFSALVYTRFLFESDGKKVALKRREVFPYPEGNAKNYHSEVSISND